MLIVKRCEKLDGGLPLKLRGEMMGNISLSVGVGLVPFIGDIWDAIFKCNRKNVQLLEKHLYRKYISNATDGNVGPAPGGRGQHRLDTVPQTAESTDLDVASAAHHGTSSDGKRGPTVRRRPV